MNAANVKDLLVKLEKATGGAISAGQTMSETYGHGPMGLSTHWSRRSFRAARKHAHAIERQLMAELGFRTYPGRQALVAKACEEIGRVITPKTTM